MKYFERKSAGEAIIIDKISIHATILAMFFLGIKNKEISLPNSLITFLVLKHLYRRTDFASAQSA
jgi:hypothetical protein